jgi:hypothetical protein
MSVLTGYKHSKKIDDTMSHVTTMANCTTAWLPLTRITDDTRTAIFMVQNESLVNGFTSDGLDLQTCILFFLVCVDVNFVLIIFFINTSWADFLPAVSKKNLYLI